MHVNNHYISLSLDERKSVSVSALKYNNSHKTNYNPVSSLSHRFQSVGRFDQSPIFPLGLVCSGLLSLFLCSVFRVLHRNLVFPLALSRCLHIRDRMIAAVSLLLSEGEDGFFSVALATALQDERARLA